MEATKFIFNFLSIIACAEIIYSSSSSLDRHSFIKKFDVSCNQSGIMANMSFKNTFRGVIYALGSFSNSVCRRTAKDVKNGTLIFYLPTEDCGTFVREVGKNVYLSNTIVIQRHSILQTDFDVPRNVSCMFTPDKSRTLKQYSPHESHMVRYLDEEIETWIEFMSDSDDVYITNAGKLKVGDEFMLAVHMRDKSKRYDLTVQNCVAHDEETTHASEAVINLYNSDSCDLSRWTSKTIHDVGWNASHTIAYMKLKAFKFPGKLTVHFTCLIEVCTNFCPTSCEISGQKQNNVKARRVKRADNSLSNKSFQERHRLMKATIQALGKKLISKRGERQETDTEYLRRNANATRRAKKNKPTTTTPAELEEFYYEEIENFPETDENLLNSKTGDVNLPSVLMLTSETENTFENEIYHLNLTNEMFVLSAFENYPSASLEISSLEDDCVERMKFRIVIGILATVLLCFFISCVCLLMYVRKQNKKHRIESFLLYNLR